MQMSHLLDFFSVSMVAFLFEIGLVCIDFLFLCIVFSLYSRDFNETVFPLPTKKKKVSQSRHNYATLHNLASYFPRGRWNQFSISSCTWTGRNRTSQRKKRGQFKDPLSLRNVGKNDQQTFFLSWFEVQIFLHQTYQAKKLTLVGGRGFHNILIRAKSCLPASKIIELDLTKETICRIFSKNFVTGMGI